MLNEREFSSWHVKKNSVYHTQKIHETTVIMAVSEAQNYEKY